MVCTLLACAALLPASAAADSLRTYRVDQPLRLDAGQSGSFTLACESGDLVTDGTWMVDAVDDAAYDLVSGIDVLEADAISAQSYRFTLRNNTQGQAQIHLAVACLDGDIGGDTRRLRPLGAPTTTAAVAPGLGTAPTVTCPAGSVAIAPGFLFTGAPGAVARTIALAPAVASTTTVQLGLAAIDPVAVTASARCLALTTTRGADGTRHALRVAYRTAETDIGDGRRETYTLSCRSRETAISAGFRLSEAWYLGEDQAGRQRSFRVLSPATGSPGTASLGLLCLRDHTTAPAT